MEDHNSFRFLVSFFAVGTVWILCTKESGQVLTRGLGGSQRRFGDRPTIGNENETSFLGLEDQDDTSIPQLKELVAQESARLAAIALPPITAREMIEAQKESYYQIDGYENQCTDCCKQTQRLSHIREYCRQHPELQEYLRDPRNSRTPFRFIPISKNHNVLMCLNMKAGSRLWGDTLVRSSSLLKKKTNQSAPFVNSIFYDYLLPEIDIVNIRDLTAEEIINIVSTYFKIIVVRHPMERILSAYRDKFVYSPMGQGSLDGYNYVLEKYRNLPPSNFTSLQTRKMQGEVKISLNEFVRMVTDPEAPFNVHWDQYVTNCNPCVIKYDYVIRSETTTWDAPPVMEILSRGVDKTLLEHNLISRDQEQLEKNLEKPALQKEFREFVSVDKANLERLLEHFKTDMDMFGYSFNVSSMQASCGLTNKGNGGCC